VGAAGHCVVVLTCKIPTPHRRWNVLNRRLIMVCVLYIVISEVLVFGIVHYELAMNIMETGGGFFSTISVNPY
jgi:hypothetical protein